VKINFDRLTPLLVSILPPWVFLFYLYRQNAEYVSYRHVFITALFLTLAAGILHVLVALVVRSSQAAMILTNLLWVLAFVLKPVYGTLSGVFGLRLTYLIYVLCVFLLGVALLLFLVQRFIKRKEFTLIVAVFWLVMFTLNFIPATFSYVSDGTQERSGTIVKTSFVVNGGSPSPNIYWFFMDGMLGFDAFDYLFHDSQMDLSNRLTERDFTINRGAQFETFHATINACPSLMSPCWYDTVMAPALASIDLNNYASKMSFKYKNQNSLGTIQARQKNELIAAFTAKGYQTNAIIPGGNIFLPSTTRFYVRGKDIRNNNIEVEKYNQIVEFDQLEELFYVTSIFKSRALFPITEPLFGFIRKIVLDIDILPSASDDTTLYLDPLLEILSSPSPRLTIMHNLTAHFPFMYDEDGTMISGRTSNEQMDSNNYPPQHRLAARKLLEYIDLIIAHEPDAIIVVQADHGLHGNETRDLLLASGKTDGNVRLVQNSTISAVRIPEKWGGGDAPLEPLNIARFLVNRFVGENYRILTSDEIIR
jgi:hypothetical protein